MEKTTIKDELKYHKVAFMLWFVILVYLCIYTLTTSHVPASMDYYNASNFWRESQNIYQQGAWAFIYFPQSAILYLPFVVLPFKLSQVLWNIISVGLLATSLLAITSLTSFPKKRTYLILSIICFIVAQGSLKMGQMNIEIATLMFFTIYTLCHQRWWMSAFLLMFAIALKPTALIFVLLFFALYKELRIKMLVFFIAFLLFPFLFQHPNYVMAQYHNLYFLLHTVTTENTWSSYAQLWTIILLTTHFYVPAIIWLSYSITGVCALMVLILSYYIKKTFSFNKSIFYIYTLAASYLMLFNPRTENNDYIIVMPMICLYVFYRWYKFHNKKEIYFLSTLIFFITFNSGISSLLHMPNILFRPFCVLLFLVYGLSRVSILGKSK